jgi:hypothetical protein
MKDRHRFRGRRWLSAARIARSIGWSIPQAPRAVTLENPDLVTEHHDFDVLVGLGSAGEPDEAKEAAHSDVEERRPRRIMVECRRVVPVQRPNRVLVSFNSRILSPKGRP